MKFKDGLDPQVIQKLNDIKLQEKLTTKEWRELMGMNRDIYTRKNGAVRRR